MPENENLPNVPGLEAVAASIVNSDAAGAPPANEPQNSGEPPATPAGPAKTADGKTIQFKTLEDAFTAYQAIQGFASQVANENKTLKEQLAETQRMMETVQLSMPQANQGTPQPQQQQSFDAEFIQNPEQAIAKKAAEIVQQTRIAEVLSEKEAENKDEFMERYAFARNVIVKYPGLLKSAAGIRRSFELGDAERARHLRSQGERFMKMAFGDEIDMEKLKSQFGKSGQLGNASPNINQNLAYMPDTGSHTGNRSQPANQGHDARINEAAAKGDIDATVGALFGKILAST